MKGADNKSYGTREPKFQGAVAFESSLVPAEQASVKLEFCGRSYSRAKKHSVNLRKVEVYGSSSVNHLCRQNGVPFCTEITSL